MVAWLYGCAKRTRSSMLAMTMKKYRQLNDISAYVIAFHLSNYVWDAVMKWDYAALRTLGMQFITSTDSISANIAEGFGRWGKKDRIKFYRYSFGSAYESLDWNEKARRRHLITEKQYQHIFSELQKLPKRLKSSF